MLPWEETGTNEEIAAEVVISDSVVEEVLVGVKVDEACNDAQTWKIYRKFKDFIRYMNLPILHLLIDNDQNLHTEVALYKQEHIRPHIVGTEA